MCLFCCLLIFIQYGAFIPLYTRIYVHSDRRYRFLCLASACDMQIPFLLHTFQGVVAMGTHCFADFN